MIVRISTEGQYRVESKVIDKLNEIDNQLVNVVAKGDEAEFERLFCQMIDMVRREGKPVPVEELVESDVILPAADTRLHEAQRFFAADGMFAG
jgi:hypothetical protein